MIRKYIGDLYIGNRWYLLLGGCAIVLFFSFFIHFLFIPAAFVAGLVLFLGVIDYMLLFFMRGGISATRAMAPRFSIGEENTVTVTIANNYPFKVAGRVVDELPFQFQDRDFSRALRVPGHAREAIAYTLRPLTRGIYSFGGLLCFVSSPLGLMQRRFTAAGDAVVRVYPAYQQMRKYQLMAVSGTTVAGSKKVRRLGHSLEFEKIKDYVQGDDVRTINWQATARSGNIMVNTFTDTRQQQVYCLIDKGRNMKMPFEGMSLLDHAINAALALLSVALLKQDKAGLITYADKVNDVIPADRRNDQMHRIIETLYRQQTDFKESDHDAVWSIVQRSIGQRSLILLFTNFETYTSLERQLPFLRKMASRHLLCVVFFQNTLLRQIHESNPDDIEGIYIKTIANQFDLEKRLIVKELRRYGILSILTTPASLSVDVINKYLEMKARQML